MTFTLPKSTASKRGLSVWKWGLLVLGSLILLDVLRYFVAEGLWFAQVGFESVFWLQLQARLSLGLSAFGGSFGFSMLNLGLAQRLKPLVLKQPDTPRLGLRQLLGIGALLALIIGGLLVYHGQVALSYWQQATTVYDSAPPLPLWATPESGIRLVQSVLSQPILIGALVAGAIAFLIYPQVLSAIAAIALSLCFGLVISDQWPRVLPLLRPTAFGQSDPLFQNDIGLYIFALPVAELLEFWLSGLLFFSLVTVTLTYLLSGKSLSQGRFYGFSQAQQRHLYGLAGALLLVTSLSHLIARYELLFSQQSIIYGAAYTDVNLDLPAHTGLSLIALVLGLALLWRTVFWAVGARSLWDWVMEVMRRQYDHFPPVPQRPPTLRLLVWGLSLYLLLAMLGILVAPRIAQRLVVQPNELAREAPFIERSIAFTRAAFNLNSVEDETFIPEGNLTAEALDNNARTIRNIRLWDTRPLLQSNRQLQQIRSYYEFADANVDRYYLLTDGDPSSDPQWELQQVLISARELNYEQVPEQAKTWVNEHLIYTHGYGFTMSPVNTTAPGGLPNYFIRDIAHNTSSEAVRKSIPVGQPRIYFGELTNTYIMTNTRASELDYPSGNDNVYTTYDGSAGIGVGSLPQRLLFARHMRDWQMLFSADFTADTRLLFRRNIQERVQAIAPFLRFDTDPYLVIADAEAPALENYPPEQAANRDRFPDDRNYLYWMLDAYTTSNRYPYSDPGDNDFNYIRNSVKVIIDAYNGSVSFYIADPSDPLIQTWAKLLPGMFQPLEAMPPALRQHIRYPRDLFQVQSDQLMTFHMNDPQVFYNREDLWRAPNEIYANEAREVEPYYLIMRLPLEGAEEFVQLRPFTPAERNNLIAWMAARSDGDRYGSILLYRFPKQELVFGPEQVEARINQDPEISQRISLWNTEGSRAIQGNLLVIPIERSLLYVEPLYLEAEQNSLPTLVRVIVAFQNRIAMAGTLEKALEAIFGGTTPDNIEQAPAILRDLGNPDDADAPNPLQDLVLPNAPQENAPEE
ncbi:MAG: UPF0182 family protein [Cyanobacteria bacterium P01_H01_bin.119]